MTEFITTKAGQFADAIQAKTTHKPVEAASAQTARPGFNEDFYQAAQTRGTALPKEFAAANQFSVLKDGTTDSTKETNQHEVETVSHFANKRLDRMEADGQLPREARLLAMIYLRGQIDNTLNPETAAHYKALLAHNGVNTDRLDDYAAEAANLRFHGFLEPKNR